MRHLLIIAALLAATPASAQSWGTTVRPSRPQSDSPSSRPGSYTNPYVVQDQQGRQLGTMHESRPSQPGGAQGGSYTNPYVYKPNNPYR